MLVDITGTRSTDRCDKTTRPVCIGVKNFEVDAWSGWPTIVATLAGKSVVLACQGKRVPFETAEIRAEPPVGRLWSRAR
ncbi:hypothetical protein [Streptomyces sp. NPDC002676]